MNAKTDFVELEMKEKLLTIDELAKYLQLSRRTIFRMLKRGELPAFKVGKHVRFRWDEVDKWLHQNRMSPMDREHP